jgi:hypothetical protein
LQRPEVSGCLLFFQFSRTPREVHIVKSLPQVRVPRHSRIYVLITLATVFSIAIFWMSVHIGRRTSESLASVQAPAAPIWPLTVSLETQDSQDHRRVFPYSIIPGGAQSAQELKQAALADPVVAQHYSDFDMQKVRRVTLSAPQLMYVSYRIGNNVFWTTHKMALPKGETMLTDGRAMARTRCGNRVSAMPIRPNSASEPTVEDFNAPEFPPTLSTPYLAAYSAPPPPLFSGPAVQPAGSTVSSSVPGSPFFPLPGGPGGGGGSGGHTPPPGGGGGAPPPPVVPPVGVPEPGTAAAVVVGLGLIAWLTRRSRKTC